MAFDAARREVARRQRPWHRALIAEHAARFYLAHGVDHTGYDLLAQARHALPRLGRDRQSRPAGLGLPGPATRPHHHRAAGDLTQRRSTVTTGTIDLLGIAVRVAGAELGDQRRPGCTPAWSRCSARSPAPPACTCCCGARTGTTGWRPPRTATAAPSRSAAPATSARCRCRCCATSSGPASRWWWPTPPVMTGSPATRTSPMPASRLLAAGPAHPQPRHAARGAAAGEPASSAARSPPNGSTRSSSSPPSSPSPSTTPSSTPSSPPPARRIVATADQTRQRMERDLHDGAQQRLVSLALQLRVGAGSDAARARGATRPCCRRGGWRAGGAARDRARPPSRDPEREEASASALEALAYRSPIPVNLGLRAEGRLPEHVEVSAYYVIAEALTNAAKHARASAVSVDIEIASDVLSRGGARRRRRRRRLHRRHRPGRPQGPRGGRSAAGSSSTARPEPGPACAPRSRSPLANRRHHLPLGQVGDLALSAWHGWHGH